MSGLDKFFKNSPKPQKKPASKVAEQPQSQEKIPKKRKTKTLTDSDTKSLLNEAQSVPTIVNFEEPTESENLLQEGEFNETPLTRTKFIKYQLGCADKKCNYQRILMKSTLSPSDLICPKCGKEMRQR
ncbi:MAG: hypothetical protein RBG13Loki_1655 [Promethearchaeota archaeon CR_4]|nr:MAG: hypothetical protein RBG13Loki_1655 [Candidatus Lokiarchaeota archaeon CR_4]